MGHNEETTLIRKWVLWGTDQNGELVVMEKLSQRGDNLYGELTLRGNGHHGERSLCESGHYGKVVIMGKLWELVSLGKKNNNNKHLDELQRTHVCQDLSV